MRWALALLLTGCASTAPTAVRVEVPVPVPCLAADQLPVRPKVTPNEELKSLSDRNLVLRLAGERSALAAYAAEAAPLLEMCAR